MNIANKLFAHCASVLLIASAFLSAVVSIRWSSSPGQRDDPSRQLRARSNGRDVACRIARWRLANSWFFPDLRASRRR